MTAIRGFGLEYIDDEKSPGFGTFDLKFDVHENPLKDAVILSLFCWSRVDSSLVIDEENYGWWSRDIGSELWIVDRAKLTAETLKRIEATIQTSLQWMIDDGVVDHFITSVIQPEGTYNAVAVSLEAFKDGKKQSFLFDDVWKLAKYLLTKY